MKIKILAALALVLSGCAGSIPIENPDKLAFATAKENTKMRVGRRQIYIAKGQEFPYFELSDGRGAVLLDRPTYVEPILPMIQGTQYYGAILNANGCTKGETVFVADDRIQVVDDPFAKLTSGVCFNIS
ncbi:MAG: hypothetical protein JXR14_06255 [Paracoccaceae bacterium]